MAKQKKKYLGDGYHLVRTGKCSYKIYKKGREYPVMLVFQDEGANWWIRQLTEKKLILYEKVIYPSKNKAVEAALGELKAVLEDEKKSA